MRKPPSFLEPATPFSGSYLVKNGLLKGGLAVADAMLRLVPRSAAVGKTPERILISISGHLGDVVIGSAAIAQVRATWPHAQIGVLVGSWAKRVLEGHPDISAIHTLDHWKLNRSEAGILKKGWTYWQTRATALREIREKDYDLAIDLYPFFPNTIPLIWRAGIRQRIGYVSGGFGPLLTTALEWPDEARHFAEHQSQLLEAAGARRGETIRYSLPPLERGLPAGLPENFVVVHMGAGQGVKEWPLEGWRRVIEALVEDGETVILTGSGGQQREAATEVSERLERVHNVCDRCSWKEFDQIVAHAQLVVTVDSVTGHLASARGTSSIVLMSGMSRLEQWAPLGGATDLLTHPVHCSPCFRSRGCETMACIRSLEPDRVVEKIRSRLSALRSGASLTDVQLTTVFRA